jgi:hypothetical protein
MINVTLAHIEALSVQAPFDMRPLGAALNRLRNFSTL